ncbi:MAG: DoxX family protein [Bacteroidetes bacterium]|nr:MAG: DoxX family protein [Bacteroidota bacterium]
MNNLKTLSRLILGIIFTFSGFVKAVDPMGSAIKFVDYFNAMGLSELSSFALILAFLLSAAEFIVGLALLLNIKPRLASLGALAFMILFTPLTLWIAIVNPVQDCGCFGDAIVLSNWETFWKNIILLILSIVLLVKSNETEVWFKARMATGILGLGFLFIMIFQWYNLNHLPIIDFRPYSVGTYLPDKMIIPEGAKQDSVITYLYYEKYGEQKEFTAENYPWEDTSWVWKDTKTVLIQKGYEPPIHDFDIYTFAFKNIGDEAGLNVIDQLLADKNYSLLLIADDLKNAAFEPIKSLTNLMNYCQVHKYKTYFITASVVTDILNIHSKLPFMIDFYLADGTTLKTMIRSNPGLILLKEGKVIAKWHYNDFPSILEFEEIVK